MADKERLDIISSAIAGLLRRQDATEQRLAVIERALGLGKPVEPVPEPAPEPVPQSPAVPPEIPEPVAQPSEPPPVVFEPPAAAPVSPRPSDRLETEMGLRWVNRIGAFTLVLAAAFFFKLAVDNQWIGPAGRVILGVVAAFGTLGAADLLWRRGHRVYAHGVSGMGIAILYLSFYASFGFYQLVPHALAFVLMVSCTAMGGALTLRYDASAIAMLGLLGGFATPVLLSTGVDRPWVFLSYILLLDAAALALDRARGWRRLSVLALAATIYLYQAWAERHFTDEKRLVATVYDFAYYALFVTVPSVWFLTVPQALATLALAGIFARQAAPFSLLLLAISAAGLVLSERRNSAPGLQVTLAFSWLAYAVFYSDLRTPVPAGSLLALTTALFLLFFLWTPWRVFYRGLPVRGQELAAAALNAAAFFVAGYLLIETHYTGYLGLFAVALAVPHLGLAMILWRDLAQREGIRNAVLMYLALALACLTLAAPAQFTGFRITMAWMLEAAALVWIGQRAGAPRFHHAALVVFALGFVRLFALDAWVYSNLQAYTLVWNGRFLTFVVSAVCLWLAALWTRPAPAAVVAYLAGHTVMFWILSQEVVAWAHRVSAAEFVWNAQSAALSILWASYAVVLVACGVLWRFALNRLLGLVLLAVVVGKLYLNDIWQLRLAYRVTAFAALGLLLLLTSFLYSKYRNTIGNWWRDERPET